MRGGCEETQRRLFGSSWIPRVLFSRSLSNFRAVTSLLSESLEQVMECRTRQTIWKSEATPEPWPLKAPIFTYFIDHTVRHKRPGKYVNRPSMHD